MWSAQANNSTLRDLQKPGGLKAEAVPATIADAIGVVRSLKERFLWVDCLCIIQYDDVDKQYFIPKMDTVYQNALVTIIGLSGENSDAGLAGVRPSSRICEQAPFVIRETPIVLSLDPVRAVPWSSYLGESKWDRRGWTFQEKCFSPRILVFTAKQIYWECRNGWWCEDTNFEISKGPRIYRDCFHSKPFADSKSRIEKHFPLAYMRLAESYSMRELSFQKDALKAFEGVINFMHRT